MQIFAVNLSPQALTGVGITYIASTTGSPTTDYGNLMPLNPVSNIGTIIQTTQPASSCICISIPFLTGSQNINYGQSYPMPKPPGFNFKASWAASETAVVVSVTTEVGDPNPEV